MATSGLNVPHHHTSCGSRINYGSHGNSGEDVSWPHLGGVTSGQLLGIGRPSHIAAWPRCTSFPKLLCLARLTDTGHLGFSEAECDTRPSLLSYYFSHASREPRSHSEDNKPPDWLG